MRVAEGIHTIGHQAQDFCFDNETPAHRTLVGPVRIARDLVSNGEWLAFMRDGGYARPDLWLSDGWATVYAEGWAAPGHWREIDGDWHASRSAGCGRSRKPRRSAMSAITRPMPSRAGPASTCRARPSGRSRRGPANSTTPSASSGNGRAAPIRPIRATGRSRRRARRVQRQVHGEPDGAARLLARDPARAFPA